MTNILKHTPCLISATPSNQDQNVCEANVATTQCECQPCLRLRRDLSDAVPSWKGNLSCESICPSVPLHRFRFASPYIISFALYYFHLNFRHSSLASLASVLTSSPATPRAIGCALIAPVVSLHQMHCQHVFQRSKTWKNKCTKFRHSQQKQTKKWKSNLTQCCASRWLRRRRERSEAVARLSCPAVQCSIRGPQRTLCSVSQKLKMQRLSD